MHFNLFGANAVKPVNANIAQQFLTPEFTSLAQVELPEAMQGLHQPWYFKLYLSITGSLDCIGVHTVISMSKLFWKIGFTQ